MDRLLPPSCIFRFHLFLHIYHNKAKIPNTLGESFPYILLHMFFCHFTIWLMRRLIIFNTFLRAFIVTNLCRCCENHLHYEGGINKTPMVYRANLNFVIIDRFLSALLDRALIEVEGKIYKTTDKGITFLHHYEELGK